MKQTISHARRVGGGRQSTGDFVLAGIKLTASTAMTNICFSLQTSADEMKAIKSGCKVGVP